MNKPTDIHNAVKRRLAKVNPRQTYNPLEIANMGFFMAKSLVAERRTVYRLIETNKIKTTPVGNIKKPRHIIRGSDLITTIKEYYKIN